ncbi:MAG: hypothetical protein ABI041_16195 [Bdellovibrionia bacterium]
MRHKSTLSIFIQLFIVTLFLNSCGSSPTSDGSGSEIAVSSISGAANASEGNVALLQSGPVFKVPLLARLQEQFSLLPKAWGATCSSLITGSSCLGTVLTYALGSLGSGCTAGITPVTWTGNTIFTWTTGACSVPPQNSAANAVFTRTTDAAGVVRTVGSNSVLTTTQDSSGYASAKTGGTTITCGVAGCATNRSIVINGVHHVGSSVALAKWDHTVSTDSPVIITGAGANRVISSMTIRVQHNLAKALSFTTITTPLTHTAGCCFPTGGATSTTYLGGSFDGKTESLAFSATCGQATLTPAGGTASDVTLTHCL